jgi:hypothetical protein
MTAAILAGTISFTMEGGWATLVATGIICAVCVSVRKHYGTRRPRSRG